MIARSKTRPQFSLGRPDACTSILYAFGIRGLRGGIYGCRDSSPPHEEEKPPGPWGGLAMASPAIVRLTLARSRFDVPTAAGVRRTAFPALHCTCVHCISAPTISGPV